LEQNCWISSEERYIEGKVAGDMIQSKGRRAQETVIATPAGIKPSGYQTQRISNPAGIKQEFPIYPRAPAHMRWSPMAVKGLVYMITDKGPQWQWLWDIGKCEEQWCVCDGWTAQNAAHLMGCPWVGRWQGKNERDAVGR